MKMTTKMTNKRWETRLTSKARAKVKERKRMRMKKT
jgi:hypothetical protein